MPPGEKKRLVRDMFDALAPAYDRMDTLLSAGLDASWRRRAVRALGLGRGDRLLDVCGGTGGLGVLAARKAAPEGLAVVCDLSAAMVATGRERVRRARLPGRVLFVRGDAEALGFPDGAFDAVTIGFGLRNLADPGRGLAEMRRVLRPGGRLVILEFSLPRHALARRLYRAYSFRVMPLLGRLAAGRSGPYRYLAESIALFPSPEEVAALVARAGFEEVAFRRLTDGIAVVTVARKPVPIPAPEEVA